MCGAQCSAEAGSEGGAAVLGSEGSLNYMSKSAYRERVIG